MCLPSERGFALTVESGETMYVDAEELSRASSQIGVQAEFAALWIAPGLDSAAGSLAQTSTGAALQGAQQTITTIGGRYEEIAGSLQNAANAIVMTDELAAKLLASIGDLNQSNAG